MARETDSWLEGDLQAVGRVLAEVTPQDRSLEKPPESIWAAIQAELEGELGPPRAGAVDTETGETLRIGEVSEQTGLSRATIRAWEQQYAVVAPAQTAGGQRRYAQRDVGRLRAVRELCTAGLTVAAAAGQVARYEEMANRSVDVGSEPGGHGASGPPRRPSEDAGSDVEALSALLEASRSMLYATSAAGLSDALVKAVERLGGRVGPAELEGGDVLPVDLSLGEGEPVLPRAEPYSVARMRLEALLPALVEDARRMLTLLD